MIKIYYLFLVLICCLVACSEPQPQTSSPVQTATPDPDDPARWESDIAAFEALDKATVPPENALVFIGSSSIKLWESLAEDMAPMPVIQRGFGGSKLADATHYIDRIITPYAPRAVVIFSGSNDIAGETPKSAEAVFTLYTEFVSEVHKRLPGTPIYFIAISPTGARWAHRDIVADTNALVEAHAAKHDDLYYINTASALLDENGQSREELFREDKLHLNKDGYAVWTSIIRPALIDLYP